MQMHTRFTGEGLECLLGVDKVWIQQKVEVVEGKLHSFKPSV